MPLGSAAALARLMTALQNMYKGAGTESQVVEPTETGGARMRRSAAPAEPREAAPAAPQPRSEMTNQERQERNRRRREENRRRREAKHGT